MKGRIKIQIKTFIDQPPRKSGAQYYWKVSGACCHLLITSINKCVTQYSSWTTILTRSKNLYAQYKHILTNPTFVAQYLFVFSGNIGQLNRVLCDPILLGLYNTDQPNKKFPWLSINTYWSAHQKISVAQYIIVFWQYWSTQQSFLWLNIFCLYCFSSPERSVAQQS